MSEARRIVELLIAEGWTCYSEDPGEAEFLPRVALRAVERVLALAALTPTENEVQP